MALPLTTPRQVNVVKCALLSPILTARATNDMDRQVLNLYGYDLIPYVQRIDLYESIFDHTISGSVTLFENIGLPEYLPIVGTEFLDIAFSVDAGDQPSQFHMLFRVVSLKDQTFPKTDFRLYTLNLATPMFVQSVSTRICRHFENMTCDEAVMSICKNDLNIPAARILSEESTFGKVSMTIPLVTPLRAIHYFLMLAQTEKTPHESNFVFYETLSGFQFTSVQRLIELGKLIDQKDLVTFQVNPAASVASTSEQVIQDSILRAHQNQSFDLLFDIQSGLMRSRMIHFDILARKSVYDEFPAIRETIDSTYTNDFDQTTHLDKFPFYPINLDQTVGKDIRIFTVPSNAWSSKSAYVQSNGDEIQQTLYESVVRRNRQFKELMHSQLLLDVPGRPDVEAGSVVWVNYPSTRPLEDGGDTNVNLPIDVLQDGTQYYSGRHLVTSVHHIIKIHGGNAEYRMNLKVVKDSLHSPMYGYDKPAE